MDMVLTGRVLDARAACAMGLVSAVVPRGRLDRAARGLADELAAIPLAAITALRRAVRAAFDLPLADGLTLERRLGLALQRSGA
jgi:enoyl-CoA hydratase